jgi:hypothetical protein
MSDAVHIETFDRGDLPEHADCHHELVGGLNGVQLSSSTIRANGACEWMSTSLEGLSLGVAHGRMVFDLGDRWTSEAQGALWWWIGRPISLSRKRSSRYKTTLANLRLQLAAESVHQEIICRKLLDPEYWY